MRPSRLFLWLVFAALMVALLCVVLPALPAEWAMLPIAVLVLVFFADWIISVGPRSVSVVAKTPREVFVGEEVMLDLSLTGPENRLSNLGVEHTLSLSDGFRVLDGEGAQTEGLRTTIPLFARRRGLWMIEKVWLYWKSRLRLIDFVPVYKIDCSVNVVPNIRPVTSGQIDLDLRSALFGAKQTAWRGEGSEFHQLNEYVQGMDPRSIDWKRSARHHGLVAKEMRAERNHQIVFAMDNGHLMREEVAGLPKIDHKINAALALAWAGVQGGDQIGLFAFDARPRLFSPPRPGRAAFSHMRTQMGELEYKSIETNHTLALSHLHQRLAKRSLVVVFSDFVDPLTAQLLVEHVSILSRHHVVVFVSLRDPLLENLANAPAQMMNDIARSVSASNLIAERRMVLDKMAAQGVYVIESDPGSMTPRLINTYLTIKSQELI